MAISFPNSSKIKPRTLPKMIYFSNFFQYPAGTFPKSDISSSFCGYIFSKFFQIFTWILEIFFLLYCGENLFQILPNLIWNSSGNWFFLFIVVTFFQTLLKSNAALSQKIICFLYYGQISSKFFRNPVPTLKMDICSLLWLHFLQILSKSSPELSKSDIVFHLFF